MSSTPKKKSVKKITDSEDEVKKFKENEKTDVWKEYLDTANKLLDIVSWLQSDIKLMKYKEWINTYKPIPLITKEDRQKVKNLWKLLMKTNLI